MPPPHLSLGTVTELPVCVDELEPQRVPAVRLVPGHVNEDRDPERRRLGAGERPAAADDGELAVGNLGEIREEHRHLHGVHSRTTAIAVRAGAGVVSLRGLGTGVEPRRSSHRTEPVPRTLILARSP